MFSSIRQFFLNWSLPSLLNKTKGQGSVEVSCPWRGACVWKSSLGHCPCKAGNKNCNANCQCHWRSWNEVTKLEIIKHPAVQYFSIFLFKIQKILIRKCSSFIYNPQVLPGSLQFRTWCFSLTLYTEYEAIQTLDTKKLFNDTAGHGPQITPYFSFKYNNFSLENILPSFTILKHF